jgi:hypothetical protein
LLAQEGGGFVSLWRRPQFDSGHVDPSPPSCPNPFYSLVDVAKTPFLHFLIQLMEKDCRSSKKREGVHLVLIPLLVILFTLPWVPLFHHTLHTLHDSAVASA